MDFEKTRCKSTEERRSSIEGDAKFWNVAIVEISGSKFRNLREE